MKSCFKLWVEMGICIPLFFLFIGCGGPSSNQAKTTVIKQEQESSGVLVLKEISGSTLAYLKSNKVIHLGESVQTILSLFPKPEGAIAIRTLPPSLAPPLVANGWDTENESLGVISQEDKVVLIMHTYNQMNPYKAEEMYMRYFKHFGRPSQELLSSDSKYWFWDSRSTRLMIASSVDTRGDYCLTVAFGVHLVMDRLRMNARDAKEDQLKANQLLKKNKNSKK